MSVWLDHLPQIDAAIFDAEQRIGTQKHVIGQLREQAGSAGKAESRRSLELMQTIAAFLRDCRKAVIHRAMNGSHTRH